MQAKKKKDNRGRVLWTGESQRKSDLIYQYRYTDENHNRRYIYNADLDVLRKMEETIVKKKESGLNLAKPKLTVNELVDSYLATKQGVRYNTKKGYATIRRHIKESGFGDRRINEIKVSDAKFFLTELQANGIGYSTITSIRGVIKPAFQMAFEDDIISRNPFLFGLKGVVNNTTKERKALTIEQQALLLEFFRTDKTYKKYYDDLVVLLGTGLRVSEFCGLTLKDIDLENCSIDVNKQLHRTREGEYYVEKTKTKSGCRVLPITSDVRAALEHLVAKRKKFPAGESIDGFNNFIGIDKNKNPKVALHYENELRWALKKFRKKYLELEEFNVTPHVLRHTFCTNCESSGMDIKSVQYLMGHSDARITADVYSHARFENVVASLNTVSDLIYEKIEAA
ncbi:MAG: site-specific integrase [Lachnospiraceae bacterium]|nr:site-specific integrase [Lachnospiraceae bacterium]